MIAEIEDALFSLVPIKIEHVNDIYTYASDHENTRYMSWPTHTSIDQTIDFVNYTIALYTTGTHFVWAVYHNLDKKVIGTCAITGYKEGKKFVEIGYIISKNYWNKGFGTKIVRILIDFSFNNLNIRCIKAYCDRNNRASQRILIKNHFINNGINKHTLVRSRIPVDSMEFILT